MALSYLWKVYFRVTIFWGDRISIRDIQSELSISDKHY